MVFPGATTDVTDAGYVIIGAPLDVSSSFLPGSRFGPERIRKFSRGFEDYDHRTGQAFTACGVSDYGDVRAWDDASEYLEYLEGVVSDVVGEEAVPILLGGEHTVSVAGINAVSPDVFVCLDAHLDLRSSFDGNPWSHATVTHHALSVVDEVVVVGARSGSEDEWERVSSEPVTVVPPREVSSWEPAFDSDQTVYLSVDIDVADPSVAPATGTMEPFGLGARELRAVVRAVAPRASAVDFVEVNDRDAGQTAALAGKLLREFVYTHATQYNC